MNIFAHVACRGALNYGGYCNAELDRLLEEARAHSSADERIRLYTAVSELLSRDEPYIFLYHQSGFGRIAQSLRALWHIPTGSRA